MEVGHEPGGRNRRRHSARLYFNPALELFRGGLVFMFVRKFIFRADVSIRFGKNGELQFPSNFHPAVSGIFLDSGGRPAFYAEYACAFSCTGGRAAVRPVLDPGRRHRQERFIAFKKCNETEDCS